MISVNGIEITRQAAHLITNGLASILGREIRLRIQKRSVEEYMRVIRYLINYATSTELPIKPDQTIAYHSWILKVILSPDGILEIWEAERSGNQFIEGADYSIEVISMQDELCRQFNVTPVYPTFSQKLAISNGIYERLVVEAVRYPSPDHMTGWWLTTEQYDGNVKSLNVVHYFHVAFKRPDILKYLALPCGFRFFTGKEGDVWFDEKILSGDE